MAQAPLPYRILVLDKEPSIRDLITRALANRSYRTACCATWDEAIQNTKDDLFDIAILDLDMPGEDALDALRNLKQLCPYIEIILMTGYPNLERTIETIRHGAFDYIVKPFNLDELYSTLDQAIKHRTLAKQLAQSEEANRLQSELLVTMSHELKSAVAGILEPTQRLSTAITQRLSPIEQEDLKAIEKRAKNLFQLVSDIVELPKLSFGRIPGTPLEWQGFVDRLAVLAKDKPKATILIVDDDPSVVRLLEIILSRAGYGVHSVGDGQAALDYMAVIRPDFLLLDLMLPKLNGFEVLDVISKTPHLRNLPVIVLTAKQLTPEERQTLTARTEAIIQKGHSDINQLVSILNDYSYTFRQLLCA